MNKKGETKIYTGGGARSHLILIILSLIYMSDYADRMVVSSILNFIKQDWNISDAQAGWLTGVVLLFITILSVPTAILVDRWSRRKIIAIMTFFWSFSTLACRFAQNYTQLLIARMFVGLGEAGYSSAGAAMISAAYPDEKRARVMGIWNASIPIGIAIGMTVGGLIARKWGWQNSFGVVALPGFLLAIVAWFLPDYRTVKREQQGTGAGVFSEIWADFRGILKIRSLVFNYFAFAMNVACTTAMSHWLPSYFERVGLAEKGHGGALATPLFALVLVGVPLGGFLADAWQKKRRNGRMLLPALTSFTAAFTLLIAFLHPGHKYQFYFLVLYGIAVTCFIAPALSVTQDLVHPGIRAFAIGMGVLWQHIFGDVWSAPLIGFLSDLFKDDGGLLTAVLFIPLYGFTASILFLLGSKSYVRDLEKVEKITLEAE